MKDVKWILRQNIGLILVSIATFVGGVVYQPARWNMLTTAWGTFLGGVLAWIWFEVRGPALQRAIWLKQNAEFLGELLSSIEEGAINAAHLFLGDDMAPLNTTSLEAVIEGIAKIRSSLPLPDEAAPHWSKGRPLIEDIGDYSIQIRRAASHIVLGSLTELQMLVHVHGEWYRHLRRYKGNGVAVRYAQVMFVSVSLDLIETAYSILVECEQRPRRRPR